MFKKITKFSVNHPKIIITIPIVVCILVLFQFPQIKIDTDPENMLSEDEFVKVFHDKVKKEFSIYDFIVLGIVNEKHPQGVFNPKTLEKIYDITQQIKKIDGVVKREIIAPSTKDNIRQGGVGTVKFEWLMDSPPDTQKGALRIRNEAKDNPLFNGTMVSSDGKAMAIYVPIESKDLSYQISQEIKSIIGELGGNEEYYITGLPVAEDTFGVQMFKQMAISAPTAMVIIFLIMWFFFKNLNLIISPMLVALASVIASMGFLIGKGFPVHIMSSMIPIFLMPIAVVDAVHILSEYHDLYPKIQDRKKTILKVMEHLFMPMLYTSLTSAAGFATLALTPIPPVQVFGIFVAFGIMFAWIMTVTFIPSYIMLTKPKPTNSRKKENSSKSDFLSRIVEKIGKFSIGRSKLILIAVIIIWLISAFGVSRIEVNDNPVKWFTSGHPIRIADKVLNKHFGGTYTAYLVFDAKKKGTFKSPEVLKYMEDLQKYLVSTEAVGKTNSLTDVVKKVYYELMGGNKKKYNHIPGSRQAVAQSLISYQNSHKPDDLWHFVTPDYSKLNIWFQLKSGDNKEMSKVVRKASNYIKKHPPPVDMEHNWAGLTYINVVWQSKMVWGMLKSLLGAFVIVFFMMMFLFRSPLWGVYAIIPLFTTILFIYGMVGLVGKTYDMPVAVLSSLTLGIAVDFAIHFMQRTRSNYSKIGDWGKTINVIFQEPARAISRNAIIIAIGFLPLILAPLIPYKTVGVLLFSIMAISSLATFLILPAFITLTKDKFFRKMQSPGCNCISCFIISIVITGIVAYLLYGFTFLGIKETSIVAGIVIVVMIVLCNWLSRREVCKVEEEKEIEEE